jgi:hypothetical protein
VLALFVIYRVDCDMHGNRSTDSERKSGAGVSIRSWRAEFFNVFLPSVTLLLQIMMNKDMLLVLPVHLWCVVSVMLWFTDPILLFAMKCL